MNFLLNIMYVSNSKIDSIQLQMELHYLKYITNCNSSFKTGVLRIGTFQLDKTLFLKFTFHLITKEKHISKSYLNFILICI